MIDREEQITRAKRAEVILNDSMVQEALKALGDKYTVIWQQTKPEETEKRDQAWRAYQAVGMFRKHFTELISKGSVAVSDIKLAEERRKGIGRYLAA